jgi:hypothetical protein
MQLFTIYAAFSTYLPLFLVFRWTLWRKFWPQNRERYLNIESNEEFGLVLLVLFVFYWFSPYKNVSTVYLNFSPGRLLLNKRNLPAFLYSGQQRHSFRSDPPISRDTRVKLLYCGWRGDRQRLWWRNGAKGETVETVQLLRQIDVTQSRCLRCLPPMTLRSAWHWCITAA